MDYKVVKFNSGDSEQISDIYLEGIKTGKATFQTEIPSWQEWDNNHVKCCRLAAKDGDLILGWAALSPTSSRCVYKGVAEVSIYIREKYRGHGVGTALLRELIKESEQNGFWTLQSGIIRENEASIKLHRNCGFRVVGFREKPARMSDGVWHDVVLMEYRSKTVGID
jgi:phosphinothricin acetyltransferase